MGLGLRRRLETAAAASPVFRGLLTQLHLAATHANPLARRHPFDRAYGVRTHGLVPLYLLRTGSDADGEMVIYAGCVPSTLRTALQTLPDVEGMTFLDLGCGKGRAMVAASEYPFARIRGIELNGDLVRLARRNAAIVRRRHPDRPPIEVDVGDASLPPLSNGPTVIFIFMYHPFGAQLVKRLADCVGAATPATPVFVVYENPVHGAVFDAHPAFARWYGATLPVAPDEHGFGFDAEESLAIWTTYPNDQLPSPHDLDWELDVVLPGRRVLVRRPEAAPGAGGDPTG